jgi:hypothetical protein
MCWFGSVSLLVTLAACDSTKGSLLGGDDPAGGGSAPAGSAPGGEGNAPDPGGPACTELGRSYPGFEAGMTLEGDRVDGAAGIDRARTKPYAALKPEILRVVGVAAPDLRPDSFGEEGSNATPPPHVADTDPRTKTWYDEPRANALTLYSVASSTFGSCTQLAAQDPAMAAAPTPTTAPGVCATMARKFWSRTPAPGEIDGCVAAATVGAADETDPHKKWAWGCVSLLTSANFLAY